MLPVGNARGPAYIPVRQLLVGVEGIAGREAGAARPGDAWRVPARRYHLLLVRAGRSCCPRALDRAEPGLALLAGPAGPGAVRLDQSLRAAVRVNRSRRGAALVASWGGRVLRRLRGGAPHRPAPAGISRACHTSGTCAPRRARSGPGPWCRGRSAGGTRWSAPRRAVWPTA
jgi:hypothetical protein